MNATEFQRAFPLGSHLCRYPMPPMSELKRDMELLKKHGFNLVKLQEHWAISEPLEGHADFGPYVELVDYAESLDMGVYLGLTCEQAPTWLWQKHPDCRMVGRNGHTIYYEAQSTLPTDGKPGPCFDSPGATAEMRRYITDLVRVLGQFENIVVWNTWQEVGYWAEWQVGQSVCFCPNTLNYYRVWLKSKYGDLDNLNRAWGTKYGDWAHIAPDRQVGTGICNAQEVNWRFFMHNVQIARVLTERCEAIRQADPLRRPVFAHRGAPTIGSGEDWTYSRTQDFLGSSAYPAWGNGHSWDDHKCCDSSDNRHDSLVTELWDSISLRFDYIRSASKPGAQVWAAEFQGGPVSTGFQKGRVPSPADIRRWMLGAAATGITGLSFWVTRAEIMVAEANGFGLLDSGGETTPRFLEAARVGAAMNRYPDLFAQATRRQAPIAIIINEENYQWCSVMGGGGHLSYSIRGWYKQLWDAGIEVDFLETSQLSSQHVQDYRAIILPFPLFMAEETMEALAKYVGAGGNLISEACPGRVDENGFCRRGELSSQARRLFGVEQDSFTMVREPGGTSRWSPGERTWGEYLDATMLEGTGLMLGHRLRANVYIETYRCSEDSEPFLLHEGSPAGSVRKHGLGNAYLLGTFSGHSGTAYKDGETTQFIGMLLSKCGVAPLHKGLLQLVKRVECPDTRRMHTGNRKDHFDESRPREAWFFTNPTSTIVQETVSVGGWRSITDLLGVPFIRVGDELRLQVDSLDTRVLILED